SEGPIGPVNLGNTTDLICELEMVLKMTGSFSRLVFTLLPAGNPKQRWHLVDRAQMLLDGWVPAAPMKAGLERTVAYFRQVLGLAAACGGTAAILAVCGLAPKTWLGAPARWTLGVLALTLLLQPLNAQAMAVLQREMRFGRLYWVALSGALANTTVAVGLA